MSTHTKTRARRVARLAQQLRGLRDGANEFLFGVAVYVDRRGGNGADYLVGDAETCVSALAAALEIDAQIEARLARHDPSKPRRR